MLGRMGRAMLVAALAAAGAAAAEQRIADIQEGTNMAVALSPGGDTLVVDLLGRLWRLPAAGGGAEPLTPEGWAARNPRYSPDGGSLVYQRLIDGQWDLWLLDLDGGGSSALTATPYDEREPDFQAAGSSVVFASNQTGHYCLWELDLATRVLTQLTEEPGDASFPSVSEHGEVAYVLGREEHWALRVLTRQGVGVALRTSGAPMSAPAWRPGGGVIVFQEQQEPRSSGLSMLVLSGTEVVKPLTAHEDVFKVRVAWPTATEYIYAADGRLWRRGIGASARQPIHLFAAEAVESAPPPLDTVALDARGPHAARGIADATTSGDGRHTVFAALGDLWLLDERGRTRRLTDDPYVDADPAFTPDGESVVFVSDRGGHMDVWLLPLGAGRPIRLTNRAAKAYRPAVDPAGRRVAFLETDGLGPWAPSTLQLLDLRGSGDSRTLATGLIAPQPPEWAPDGRSLVVRFARGPDGPRSPAAPRRFDAGTDGVAAGAASPNHPASGSEAPLPEIALEWEAPGAGAPYVVQVGRLLDGISGTYRRHMDIHVEGGRITAVVGRGLKPLPAMVVDARDATIVPGLIDVHAHQSSIAGERLGRSWLFFGVTTVRELAADVPEALERGESWASGRRLGPRLVITPSRDAATPAATAAADSSAVPIRFYPGLADGLGHSLLRQASELGIPPWRGPDLLAQLARLGSAGPHYELETSLLNASYQDALSRIIASGTVITPALGALRGFGKWQASGAGRSPRPDYGALFDADEMRRWRTDGLSAESIRALGRTLAALVRGGGHVAVGTDAPAVPYGLGLHLELALLADAGIPNDQVLRLATAEGALALGLERQIGTVEEGKLADFVVLSGDPLTRITDTLSISAVVKGGVWLDRDALLSRP